MNKELKTIISTLLQSKSPHAQRLALELHNLRVRLATLAEERVASLRSDMPVEKAKLLERMLERMLEKHGKLCNCEVCTEARAAVEEHKGTSARLVTSVWLRLIQ